MEWQKLDLTKAGLIKREVDSVLDRINELINNDTINNTVSDKSIFIAAAQQRIQELEDFYVSNTHDDRAVLFEKERLRLRKALQSLTTTQKESSARSVSAFSHADRTGKAPAQQQQQQQQQQQPTRKPAQTISTPSEKQQPRSAPAAAPSSVSIAASNASRSGFPGGDGSFYPASVTLSASKQPRNSSAASVSNRSMTSSVRKAAAPIYSWEEKSEKPRREELAIDGIIFNATGTNGFYSREFQHSQEMDDCLSDRYIDFQIILSHEELLTLAARKKAEKPDVKLVKNIAASSSVHTATPYVDPKRIVQDMLRPGEPDKWMHSSSIRPNAKW